MKSLKVVLPIAIVLIGALSAFVLIKTRPEPETQIPEVVPPLVRVVAATIGSTRLDVASQGTALARTEAMLTAQVAGRITSVGPGFAPGGSFRRGDVLVQIDPRDYRLAVTRAEAEVARAEANLAREEAETAIAIEEWNDMGGGEASALVRREPQLADARATLQAAQAGLEQAKLNLARTTVRAPFAGRLRAKTADVGQSVSPGTPLAQLFATDYSEVVLPVPVDDLAFLDIDQLDRDSLDRGGSNHGRSNRGGPSVELIADYGGQRRSWNARIVRTEGEIDPQTRMLGLVARVDDPYGSSARAAGAPLPMGLFVEATIEGRTVDGVAVLPRGALRRKADPATDGSPDRVLIADDDGRLRFRNVKILRVDRDRVVIEGGLEAGERVVLSRIEAPVDGMMARTAEQESGSLETAGSETDSPTLENRAVETRELATEAAETDR